MKLCGAYNITVKVFKTWEAVKHVHISIAFEDVRQECSKFKIISHGTKGPTAKG
jgi:hypothetical protein